MGLLLSVRFSHFRIAPFVLFVRLFSSKVCYKDLLKLMLKELVSYVLIPYTACPFILYHSVDQSFRLILLSFEHVIHSVLFFQRKSCRIESHSVFGDGGY